ncbi:Transcriptional regulator PadR-like family protein [Lutibacter maritimus]|uniref:Transcriptional regulator PadR-like family protein n=2 Tax=Lutibacter maritimus TaxID=593133 RepID=A0A1I6PI64_9FLAO|nr:Transcriptional regulator PadR-like family protein [Lutibacter maritimus]
MLKNIPNKVIHKKIMHIFILLIKLQPIVYNAIIMGNQKLYKGSLQTIILKLLEENDKMYGYEITQKVKELTKGELSITEGALYPALHKLEAERLLDVEVTTVDNRLRKYYKLTEHGTKETVNRLAELEEFIATMKTIVNPKLA